MRSGVCAQWSGRSKTYPVDGSTSATSDDTAYSATSVTLVVERMADAENPEEGPACVDTPKMTDEWCPLSDECNTWCEAVNHHVEYAPSTQQAAEDVPSQEVGVVEPAQCVPAPELVADGTVYSSDVQQVSVDVCDTNAMYGSEHQWGWTPAYQHPGNESYTGHEASWYPSSDWYTDPSYATSGWYDNSAYASSSHQPMWYPQWYGEGVNGHYVDGHEYADNAIYEDDRPDDGTTGVRVVDALASSARRRKKDIDLPDADKEDGEDNESSDGDDCVRADAGFKYENAHQVHFQKTYATMAEIIARNQEVFDRLPDNFSFLDLGCAPGGFVRRMLEVPRCKNGFGVTLPESKGGYRFLLTEAENFFLQEADLFDLNAVEVISPDTHVVVFDAQDLSVQRKACGRAQTRRGAGALRIWALTMKEVAIGLEKLLEGGVLIFRFGVRGFSEETDWYTESSLDLLLCIMDLFAHVKIFKSEYFHQADPTVYCVCEGFDKKRWDEIGMEAIFLKLSADILLAATPVAPVGSTPPAAPVTPVDPEPPVAPVTPADPATTVSPVDPTASKAPVDPIAPDATVGIAPEAPVDPIAPDVTVRIAPEDPVDPIAPVAPVDPIVPVPFVGPIDPVSPVEPRATVAHATSASPATHANPTNAPTTPTNSASPLSPVAATATTPASLTSPVNPAPATTTPARLNSASPAPASHDHKQSVDDQATEQLPGLTCVLPCRTGRDRSEEILDMFRRVGKIREIARSGRTKQQKERGVEASLFFAPVSTTRQDVVRKLLSHYGKIVSIHFKQHNIGVGADLTVQFALRSHAVAAMQAARRWGLFGPHVRVRFLQDELDRRERVKKSEEEKKANESTNTGALPRTEEKNANDSDTGATQSTIEGKTVQKHNGTSSKKNEEKYTDDSDTGALPRITEEKKTGNSSPGTPKRTIEEKKTDDACASPRISEGNDSSAGVLPRLSEEKMTHDLGTGTVPKKVEEKMANDRNE